MMTEQGIVNMENTVDGGNIKNWTPASYRIKVAGCLDETWSDRLGGMKILCHLDPDQKKVTTLVGRLRDQAELTGVINSLYELHLPILSVKKLPD